MAGALLYFMQLSKQFPTLGWPGVKQKATNNSKIPLKPRRPLPEVSGPEIVILAHSPVWHQGLIMHGLLMEII